MTNENHPLDSRYIIFRYSEQGHEDEGSALALFRLGNSKLERIFSPALHFSPGNLDSARAPLLKLMKTQKIDEVVSVFYEGEFFGIKSGAQSLDEAEHGNGEVQQWSEFEPICIDDDEVLDLEREGIRVLFYDNTKREFLP